MKEILILAESKGFRICHANVGLRSLILNNKQIDELLAHMIVFELQKWLRDVHGIDITIVPSKSGYFVSIHWWNQDGNSQEFELDGYFTTYEQALKEGIKESLKLIESK